MGLFWDLIQQNQINKQETRAATIEERIAGLEKQVAEMLRIQGEMLARLEKHLGEDINKDGKIGR